MSVKIKREIHIEAMRKAGRITGEVLNLIEKTIKPGITTAEIDRIAEEYIRSQGAAPSFKGLYGYPASVCVSVNNEVIHGIPGKRVLKEGDIVSVDTGAYIDGFHGDAARTFAVGEISPKAQRLIDVTRESFFRGIKYAKNGNHLCEISGAIQDYVEANGFSVVRDYVGHGIGREMHEDPEVPNYRCGKRGPRLIKGMTLAIEPMVNCGTYKVKQLKDGWTVVTKDGSLSAHYENTVLITDGEPELLTLVNQGVKELYQKGQIVFSISGRDKGRAFIIYDYNDEYVFIVDGDVRKLDKPKKKKIIHIQMSKHIDKDIRNKIETGAYLLDSDIKKALAKYNDKL